MTIRPVRIGSAYYNSLLDEFILKVYTPFDGKVYRQPFDKAVVESEIKLSEFFL